MQLRQYSNSSKHTISIPIQSGFLRPDLSIFDSCRVVFVMCFPVTFSYCQHRALVSLYIFDLYIWAFIIKALVLSLFLSFPQLINIIRFTHLNSWIVIHCHICANVVLILVSSEANSSAIFEVSSIYPKIILHPSPFLALTSSYISPFPVRWAGCMTLILLIAYPGLLTLYLCR